VRTSDSYKSGFPVTAWHSLVLTQSSWMLDSSEQTPVAGRQRRGRGCDGRGCNGRGCDSRGAHKDITTQAWGHHRTLSVSLLPVHGLRYGRLLSTLRKCFWIIEAIHGESRGWDGSARARPQTTLTRRRSVFMDCSW